ncbi:sigma-70 family RNA polymerase sigma factor [Microbacterium sp. GXF7504]
MRMLSDRSDMELVEDVRGGDDGAYAELWRRHRQAGLAAARSITSTFDPDDLVAEAYLAVLAAIRQGGGPRNGFRPYLLTAVRNIATSWGRARRELSTDELEWMPAPPEDQPDHLDDRMLVDAAFKGLPARWQEVLWYTEVEGLKPAEVAPLLGMKPGAVAQLSLRAREGLRDAWVQAHLHVVGDDPDCVWTTARLAAYARGRTSRRDTARIEAHLETCENDCPRVLAEADVQTQRLAMVLLPLVLGGGVAAAAYLSGMSKAAGGAVVAMGAGGVGGVGDGGAGAAGSASSGGATGGAGAASGAAAGAAAGSGMLMGVGVGVAVLALVGAAALLVAAPWDSAADEPYVAIEAAAPAAEEPAPAEDAAQAPASDPQPEDVPAPVESAAPAPRSSAAPLPQRPSTAAPTSVPVPDASSEPEPEPTAFRSPSPTPTPTPTPSPTSSSTPTPTPTPVPTPVAPAAPTLVESSWEDEGTTVAVTMRLQVDPGQTVVARLDGATDATAVADEDGLVAFVATVAWANVSKTVSFTAVSEDGVESEPLMVVLADVIDP